MICQLRLLADQRRVGEVTGFHKETTDSLGWLVLRCAPAESIWNSRGTFISKNRQSVRERMQLTRIISDTFIYHNQSQPESSQEKVVSDGTRVDA